MGMFEKRSRELVRLASELVIAMIAAAVLFGFPLAGGAAARHFDTSLRHVARLAEQEGAGTGLRQVAEVPAFANLEETFPALKATDRHLLKLVTVLASPRMSRIRQKVSAHARLTPADRRFLDRAIRLLEHNSAIVTLRRRGERLKHSPTKLKSAWRQSFRRYRPRADLESTPGRTSIGTIEAALNKPVPALDGGSIAASGAALLASPAGFQYVAHLPPIALGMMFPADASQAGSAQSSGSICASGSIGPSVKTMIDVMVSQTLGDIFVDLAAKKVGKAVYWDAAFGKRGLAWKTFKRLNLATTLSRAIETGGGLADAAWNAVIKCGAASVTLVPAFAKRQAGEAQSYSLLAEDRDGKSWGGIRADDLGMSGGRCDVARESCYGEKAGSQKVGATFGRLRALGRLTVTPGPLHELRVTPEVATVGLGEDSPKYSATGADAYGNPIAVPTGIFGKVRMRIVPDGRCNEEVASCVADTPGLHRVIVEQDGVEGSARLEVSPPVELPAGEMYVPYSQELHAREPVISNSWRIVPGSSNDPYDLSPAGVLQGMAFADDTGRGPPGDLGHHTFLAEAMGLDGDPLRETFEYDVVVPRCRDCAIHVGYRMFTFSWDNPCPACTQPGQSYGLALDATLPGTPGSYTRSIMSTWGCFEDGLKRCATVYQFGDYGFGVLPGVSTVTLYYELLEPPHTVVPIGEWTVAVEG